MSDLTTSRSRTLRQAGILLGSCILMGLVGGVLWWLVTPLPHYQVVSGQVSMDAVQLMKQANSDVFYTVIATVIGVLIGGFWSLSRGGDALKSVILLVFGAAIAGLVMWQVGGWLSPGAKSVTLSGLKSGQQLSVPLRLDSMVTLLILPVAAVCASAIVLWARAVPTQPGSDLETESSDGEPATRLD